MATLLRKLSLESSTIRKVGLSIVAASVSAYFVSRLKAGKVTCCEDPTTCLCALNRTILYDIVNEVRKMPAE
jgi:hypothetical protein